MNTDQIILTCIEHLAEGSRHCGNMTGGSGIHLTIARGFIDSKLDVPIASRLSSNLNVAAACLISAPTVAAAYMHAAGFELQCLLDRRRKDAARAERKRAEEEAVKGVAG